MARPLISLLTGAAAGAAITYYLAAGGGTGPEVDGTSPPATGHTAPPAWPSPLPVLTSAPPAAPDARPAQAPARGDGSGAALRTLLNETDTATLASLAREAAAESGAGAVLALGLILSQYAAVDAAAAVRLAQELDADPATVNALYRRLAQADPETALRMLRQEGPPQALEGAVFRPALGALEQVALQQLARQDPLRALAYIDELDLGPERQSLLQLVARGYGSTDPEGALAWAQRLPTNELDILAAVISGIAETDIDQAVDMALTALPPAARGRALMFIGMRNILDEGAGRIASRLLAEGGQAGADAARSLLTTWARGNPDAALPWLLAHDGALPAGIYQNIAAQLAMSDPDTAAAYLHRVPGEARAEWLAAVARGYANRNVHEAESWLQQHRYEPGYPAAAATLVQAVAVNDPASAARMVADLDEPYRASTAHSIAMQWARHDPRAAANWALEQQDVEMQGIRQALLSNVVSTWAGHDPDGARAWATTLADPTERDAVLHVLVNLTAGRQPLQPQLLASFASPEARQQAVASSIFSIAQRDENEARTLISQYITDPTLRERAEMMLQRESGALIPVRPSPGGFFGPVIQSETVPR